MKRTFAPSLVLSALALSTVSAQQSRVCTEQDRQVCYSVNVPTTSGNNGDLFFQITGPSSYQWIGLGQGHQMKGSNIFIIYSNAAGNNVTLSPRLGMGNKQPEEDHTAAVTLLEGSGITNGKMTANIHCSNCSSWSGGSMDLSADTSSWIWAFRSGQPIASDSAGANLQQHEHKDSMTVDLTKARSTTASSNPFIDADPASISTVVSDNGGTASSSTSSSSSDDSSSGSDDSDQSSLEAARTQRMTTAHGVIMCLAFGLFFPVGSMVMRLPAFFRASNPASNHPSNPRSPTTLLSGRSERTTNWPLYTHIIIQLFAYAMAIAGLGMGAWIATTPTYELDYYHPTIGLVVVGVLVLQPVTGSVHHWIFFPRKDNSKRRTLWAQGHIWIGRVFVTLGIINGGLGLHWSNDSQSGEIAYGVVASMVWLTWIVVAVFSERREAKTASGVSNASESESEKGPNEGQKEKSTPAVNQTAG